jgi:hypothetical protein
MEKGILTKKTEKKLGQGLDDLIKLPTLLEGFDGAAFTLAIRAIDNNFGEKIPEPYKTELREQFELIFDEENYEEAVKKGFDFIDGLIDIPGIDDETERLIFAGLANIVIGLILNKK